MEDKSKVRLLITFLRDFLTKHTFKADIEFPEVQRVVVENQQEIVIPTSITVDNLEEVIEGAKGLSTEVIQAIEAGLKTLAKELKPEKAEKLGIKLEAIKKILDRPMKQADVLGALKKLESVIKDKELNIDLKPVLKKLDSFNFDPLEKYIKYGAVKTRLDDKQFEKLLDAFKTIPVALTAGGSSGGSTDVSALALEATLSSIKDTDGIKKITDPVDTELPAAAAVVDGAAVSPTTPVIEAYNSLASAGLTTRGPQRMVGNGADSVGTGIAAAGIMAQFDDTSPGTVTENRFGNVRMSVRRELYGQIRDAAGNERGVNVTATNSLQVLDDNSAAIKTAIETIDNAISGSEMQVDVVGALPAGTNNIGDVDVLTLPGVAGTVAHDAADSGNPVKIGYKAATLTNDDTLVADADRVDAIADLDGAQIVRNQYPLGEIISERVSNTNGTSTAFSNFGAVASKRYYITAIHVYNASATAGFVDFRDGTAGSVLYTLGLPAGGGAVLPAGATPYFRTTANTALAFDVSAALTTVYISITGFLSKI